jgi:chemotaxis protein histidine kinase CheA/CheY-like chemotaxis protein
VHGDKDTRDKGLEGVMDPEEESRDNSLEWLLDMDFSEPEETLFRVKSDDQRIEGLSAYEAEVASRPLIRGNTGSDSLDNFVSEEIVYGASTSQIDIYDTGEQHGRNIEPEVQSEVMAVDYTRDRATVAMVTTNIEEGADILGLSSDDDIGETFLRINRVKPRPAAPVESEQPTAPEQDSLSVSAREAIVSSSEPVDLPLGALDLSVDALDPLVVTLDMATLDIARLEQLTNAVGSLGDTADLPGDLPLDSVDVFGENIDLAAAAADLSGDAQSPALAADKPESESLQESAVDANAADMNLTEAPAPTQVDTSNLGLVANEEYSASDDFSGADDFLSASAEEDEAFEQMLEAAADNSPTDEELEALVFSELEELESGDFSADEHIDYPADLQDVAQDNLADVLAVLAPLTQELTELAATRLQGLAMATDAVAVDVTVGADEAAIKHCYAEGYEPVLSVCGLMPQALESLVDDHRDMLYAKFSDTANGSNWNHLFSEDFAMEHGSAPINEQAGEQVEEAVVAFDFLDDFLGDEFDDNFDTNFAAAADVDIEQIFADVSSEDDFPATDEEFQNQFAGVVDGEEAIASVSVDAQPQVEGAEVERLPTARLADDSEDIAQELEAQSIAAAEVVPSADGSNWFIPDDIRFDYTSASSSDIFADFLDSFIEEGSEVVEKLEDNIGTWEKDILDNAACAEVTRTLHTIKGIAKGVGLHRMGTLVHNFETLLDKLSRPTKGEEQQYFRIVNTWLDAVVRGVEFIREHRVDIASELPVARGAMAQQQELQKAQEKVDDNVEDQSGFDRVEAVVSKDYKSSVVSALEKKRDQELADEGAKVLAAQQSVRLTSEKMDHLLNMASQAQQFGVRASQSISRNKRSSSELQGRLTSVRTHIRKIADRALFNVSARGARSRPGLDALEMDQYSELQEAASILREGIEDLTELVDLVSRQNSQVEGLLKQQSTVISGISSSIQGARVVPVSRLMPGLRRIVRTVSADLGKVVSFKILNETGALDRDRYARLQVILEHMVRNALDHGIEAPDQRVAVGKPTGGRITIDVSKSGGDYVIKLADDGRGMDPHALRESAYEKGLDIDVDALSDEEVLRLVFHKGFSTATEVSEVSGRGVGMDIVLTELQQIGGDIQISSALGVGTSFEVRIPSNVTVNGALLVSAADDSYAIPLNGLVAVEQVPVEEFFSAVEEGRGLHLADLDCEPSYLGTLCQGVGLPDRARWDAFVPVIIAGSEDHYMAIAIDNLEEALELVVRSIGPQFSTVPGVAGAATTSDGEAVVALDLNLLVSNAGSGQVATVASTKPENSRLLALVVDDSRTQRMVATSRLDTVGVETVTAENGLVAIDLLNASHRLPDVVLLDVEMPVKDGIETLREIRKSRRYGDLPVIMVTSRTGAKHRAMAKQAGCNAYMGKPFNFPALIEQINLLTGRELVIS